MPQLPCTARLHASAAAAVARKYSSNELRDPAIDIQSLMTSFVHLFRGLPRLLLSSASFILVEPRSNTRFRTQSVDDRRATSPRYIMRSFRSVVVSGCWQDMCRMVEFGTLLQYEGAMPSILRRHRHWKPSIRRSSSLVKTIATKP